MPQLLPPAGLPNAIDLDEEAAWQAMSTGQLERVRKTAENWRTGLAAILSVITASLVIKGPSEIQGLSRGVGYAAGILLFAGIATACAGVWFSVRAATGEPRIVTREEIRDQGGMGAFSLQLSLESAHDLRWAQGATIVAALLIAGAIGVSWYGPREAVVSLKVERQGYPALCGALLPSPPGFLDIKPSGQAAVRVRLGDVESVQAGNCP